MRTRKWTIAATAMAATITAAWAVTASSASCTLCFNDPVSGQKVCFENMCAYLKNWLPFPPDAYVKAPISIATFAKDLQDVLEDPGPKPWVLINPATQRQFIVDMQKATMTEVIAGTQSR